MGVYKKEKRVDFSQIPAGFCPDNTAPPAAGFVWTIPIKTDSEKAPSVVE